ncbi:MAG: hypothetical protein DHS20C13_14320 [Thermodesulfobacteriota bacterium]|nr:MAG: hypothetical protein DHS20C13_14320 [Thermodesulfobacteriota bacterium]
MESRLSDIERYLAYFEEELERIKSLESTLYSKILIYSIIDCISRTLNLSKSNHKKFVKYIEEVANWDGSNKVSLIQLYWNLQEEPKLITNKLCRYIKSRLVNVINTKGSILSLNIDEIDLHEQELVQFIEDDSEIKKIKNAKHSELLYIYRNHLIHEFRIPGYGFERNASSPFYSFGFRRYELVYPKQFLLNLVCESLPIIKDYYIVNQINPLESYDFSSLWNIT